MQLKRTSITLGLTMLVTVVGLIGAEENPSRLTMKTERVVVFKDGYCLIIKHAEGMTNDKGEVYTDQVPSSAVLGSYWATPKDGTLLSMVAERETETTSDTKKVLCTRHVELLQANKGAPCSVEIRGKVYEGTILEILAHAKIAGSAQNELFVLRSEDGDQVLKVSEIQRLSIPNMKTTRVDTQKTTKSVKRFRFQFKEKNAKQELQIIYFMPGFRWIPTYRVELMSDADKGKKMAKISLQAEILNEGEDLVDVPMDLVVGVPNFKFKDAVSPLCLEQVMRNALRVAAPRVANQFSNAMMSQQISNFQPVRPVVETVAPAAGVTLPAQLTATGTQDLFIYHLPKMTMKRGARTATPIFSAKVPYRDVYTWNVSVKRKGERASSSNELSSPLSVSYNRVWHTIELENTTKLPWTTGAAMVMQERLPLCQELLTYTSSGNSVRVPVTVATDLHGSYGENEVKRTPKAMRVYNHDYMKVDKTGKITLMNYKNTDVTIEIECGLGGRATAAEHDARIGYADYRREDWTDYQGKRSANQHSTILWKKTVKAKESFTAKIDYHYFLLH